MSLIKCPECEREFSSNAKNCPNCGYPTPIVCSDCGSIISDDSKSCPKCGNTILENPKDKKLETKGVKKNHGCMVVVTLIIIFIVFANYANHTAEKKLSPQEKACKTSYKQCTDTQMFMNHYTRQGDIRFACKKEANKKAFGRLEWPDSEFKWAMDFDPQEGTITYIDEDVKFQSGVGEKLKFYCYYDLENEQVLSVSVN